MKKLLLASLALASLFTTEHATAQGVRAQSLGVELGGQNGLRYELQLSQRFSFKARAGLGIGLGYRRNDEGERKLRFLGLTPYAELTPRWHFSRESSSPYYKSGGYLAYHVGITGGDKMRLFAPKAGTYGWTHYILNYGPTVGWVLGINERSALQLGVGLGFYRERMRRDEGPDIWRTSAADLPILIETSYNIYF